MHKKKIYSYIIQKQKTNIKAAVRRQSKLLKMKKILKNKLNLNTAAAQQQQQQQQQCRPAACQHNLVAV